MRAMGAGRGGGGFVAVSWIDYSYIGLCRDSLTIEKRKK